MDENFRECARAGEGCQLWGCPVEKPSSSMLGSNVAGRGLRHSGL